MPVQIQSASSSALVAAAVTQAQFGRIRLPRCDLTWPSVLGDVGEGVSWRQCDSTMSCMLASMAFGLQLLPVLKAFCLARPTRHNAV